MRAAQPACSATWVTMHLGGLLPKAHPPAESARNELRCGLPQLAGAPARRGAPGNGIAGAVRAAHAAARAGCQDEHRQRRELCAQARAAACRLCMSVRASHCLMMASDCRVSASHAFAFCRGPIVLDTVGRRPRTCAVHGAALAESDSRWAQALNSVADRCAACPPGWLAVRAEGVLAVLVYARAELLWWFRHWGAVPARPIPWLLFESGKTELPPARMLAQVARQSEPGTRS
jgi:hypothetical protein